MLILSSEWSFSPHVRQFIDLPNYILLGFPASESTNPLLIPLAGHEFGHTTWQRKELALKFGPLVQSKLFALTKEREAEYEELFSAKLDSLFAPQNLAPAYQSAMHQAEEVFCDFFGVRLFGVSYLYAFAYLLTPGGTRRSAEYPALEDRIANLVRAVSTPDIELPIDFADSFLKELKPKCSPKDQFLLDLADAASASINDQLLQESINIANRADMPMFDAESVASITASFRTLSPASNAANLTSILTAAWELYYDMDLWNGIVEKEGRLETLHELVLKSIEILEFEERMAADDDS